MLLGNYTSNNITMNLSSSAIFATSNSESVLANVDNVAEVNMTGVEDDDDDVIGNLHWMDDQHEGDLLANQNNVNGDSLLLPDDNLFQLLSELDFQPSIDDDLLDGINLPNDKGDDLLGKVDLVDKSKGKELLKDTKHRRSPRDGHRHGATKKTSKKRNSEQKSRRRLINDKLQTLQSLMPHPDLKRDHASILNDASKQIRSLKHQIETTSRWSEMRQLQQATYAPVATYMPMMMRPNIQLGDATMTRNAIAGVQQMTQMPTSNPILCPIPPATTSFAPVFFHTNPWIHGNFEQYK